MGDAVLLLGNRIDAVVFRCTFFNPHPGSFFVKLRNVIADYCINSTSKVQTVHINFFMLGLREGIQKYRNPVIPVVRPIPRESLLSPTYRTFLSPPSRPSRLSPLATLNTSPIPCGNSTVFCSAGSSKPSIVSSGNYTVGGTSEVGRTADEICPRGRYCLEGLAVLCPSGTYGEVQGLQSEACSGPCPAGEHVSWQGIPCCAVVRFSRYVGRVWW